MTRLLYGGREIAAELGLTVRQAYKLVERGLPVFRPGSGRTIVARADAVEAWLKAQAEGPDGSTEKRS